MTTDTCTRARFALVLLLVFLVAVVPATRGAGAQSDVSGYSTTKTIVFDDGARLDETVIGGPPAPPPGYELERTPVTTGEPSPVLKNLTDVPGFNWVFGCSAVSGAMVAGYYDRNGYPNMYTGPTNGGVMPLNNSVWPTWSDGSKTYPNLPLAASHKGVDGRTTRGSIDDYWIKYGSTLPDPYLSGGWPQHAWGTAIGDYMKTSQSKFGNTDGSTTFYTWTSNPAPLTCAQMVTYGIHTKDGTFGRKLFYEARGYTVTDCYSQKTSNTIAGGFSYAQYKAQINANRPVVINLLGHTVVGVGYNDPNTIYIHDTWDYADHAMTWGGSYVGMPMQSVSIVNLKPPAPTCTPFDSQFSGSAAGWTPVVGPWALVSGGYYQTTGLASLRSSTAHVDTYTNFTYEARVKRPMVAGSNSHVANALEVRGKPTALTPDKRWKPSYHFQYTNDGSVSVWRTNPDGSATALKMWSVHPAVKKYDWNTLKVVASGSSFKYYVNGVLVWSGTDSAIASGQVGLSMYRDAAPGPFVVDWAKLTCATTGAEVVDEVVPGVEVSGGTLNVSP